MPLPKVFFHPNIMDPHQVSLTSTPLAWWVQLLHTLCVHHVCGMSGTLWLALGKNIVCSACRVSVTSAQTLGKQKSSIIALWKPLFLQYMHRSLTKAITLTRITHLLGNQEWFKKFKPSSWWGCNMSSILTYESSEQCLCPIFACVLIAWAQPRSPIDRDGMPSVQWLLHTSCVHCVFSMFEILTQSGKEIKSSINIH
jgi:hypothetical protein